MDDGRWYDWVIVAAIVAVMGWFAFVVIPPAWSQTTVTTTSTSTSTLALSERYRDCVIQWAAAHPNAVMGDVDRDACWKQIRHE